MTKVYLCRVVRPKKSAIYKVTANSISEAANETHFKARIQIQSGLAGLPCFAVIEVDGIEYLSKVFYGGIGRAGGIKPTYPNLSEIAKLLGFPKDDFTGEFDGEELEGRPIGNCGSAAELVVKNSED